eukprot:11224283-Lingulodinium_polyedra.AAC.1
MALSERNCFRPSASCNILARSGLLKRPIHPANLCRNSAADMSSWLAIARAWHYWFDPKRLHPCCRCYAANT